MSYSSSVLSLLIFFFVLATIIAGSSLYYIERLSNTTDNQLISIVEGISLAISTISTLGAGDVVPKSFAGMVFGAITTVVGVLIIDLPMPIIVETFANFNSHLQTRQQLPKQRRRVTPAAIPRKIKPLMPPNGHAHANRYWSVREQLCSSLLFSKSNKHLLFVIHVETQTKFAESDRWQSPVCVFICSRREHLSFADWQSCESHDCRAHVLSFLFR